MIRRDIVDMVKTKAIVQSIVKQEAGKEAWEGYFKEAFPWVATAQTMERQDHIKKLMSEVRRGPIKVTQVFDAQKTMRSRLRTKVIERRQAENVLNDVGALTSKLPSAIPGGPRGRR